MAENRNIPICTAVTQTTAPRLVRICKSGHHEYFDRFSILFCKSALHLEALLQNAFYYYLPLLIRMSKYPSAHMRGQGTSASLRLGTYIFVFHTMHICIRTGLVSKSLIRRWGNKLVSSWLDGRVVHTYKAEPQLHDSRQ